jgi:hypothetical protein
VYDYCLVSLYCHQNAESVLCQRVLTIVTHILISNSSGLLTFLNGKYDVAMLDGYDKISVFIQHYLVS